MVLSLPEEAKNHSSSSDSNRGTRLGYPGKYLDESQRVALRRIEDYAIACGGAGFI